MLRVKSVFLSVVLLLLAGTPLWASETSLAIPNLDWGSFIIFGMKISAWWLLFCGAMVIAGTLGISLYLRAQVHKLQRTNPCLPSPRSSSRHAKRTLSSRASSC